MTSKSMNELLSELRREREFPLQNDGLILAGGEIVGSGESG